MPAGFITAITGIAGTLGASAAAADVIGGVLGSAAFGSVLGGSVSALEGHGFGSGALTGAITGGALGFAPEIGATLGIGTTGADALAGAAGGAISSGIQGGNVGKGALFGGAEGLATGLISGGGLGKATSPSGSASSAAGASAGAGQAAPAVTSGASLPADVLAGSTGAGIEGITVSAPSLGGALPGASPGVAGLGAGAAIGAGALTAGGGNPAPATLNSDPGQLFAPGSGPLGSSPGGVSLGGAEANLGGGGAAGALGGPTSSIGKFAHDPSLKSFGNILTSNPGTVVGALGLGYEALTKPSLPDTSALVGGLKSQADALSAQGSQLQSFINTGTLPAGAQAAVSQATQSAKAAIKSQYAQLGLSGSTSEATALAGVDRQAAGQVFDIANSLLQTGIKESGLSAEIYGQILGQVNAENGQLSSAISNFAAAAAGGGSRGLNINVGGSGT